jgi:hypothetical protein
MVIIRSANQSKLLQSPLAYPESDFTDGAIVELGFIFGHRVTSGMIDTWQQLVIVGKINACRIIIQVILLAVCAVTAVVVCSATLLKDRINRFCECSRVGHGAKNFRMHIFEIIILACKKKYCK